MKKNIKKIILTSFFIIFAYLLLTPLTLCYEYFKFYKNIDTIKKDFSNEELQYFYEIAYNTERNIFDKKKNKKRLQFWIKDLTIKLHGDYTKNDSLEIVRIIDELNLLMNDISIRFVDSKNNVDIYFIKPHEFENYIEHSAGQWGYFLVQYNIRSIILVDKYLTNQLRNHILREEITQILGLCNDTNDYRTSIFYKGFSDITELSEIDKKLIQLLYNYNLPYFLSKTRFEKIFLKQKKEN